MHHSSHHYVDCILRGLYTIHGRFTSNVLRFSEGLPQRVRHQTNVVADHGPQALQSAVYSTKRRRQAQTKPACTKLMRRSIIMTIESKKALWRDYLM